ncbi:MAG: hypothetical protein AAF490_23525 [Chloroflexota bacterium]
MKNRENHAKYFIILAICLMFLGVSTSSILAHGTDIRLTVAENDQVQINAIFDTGEPMSEAQIIVYAANDPQTAWHNGVADMNGTYFFPVDTSIAGDWAITVRTAGHGELLHFTVSERGVISTGAETARPAWQTTVGALFVVIMLGGVAYFYSRPKQMTMAEARA